MPRVIYISSDGAETEVNLPLGASIMEGAVQNDIHGIVAECGGSCMCATCHVYIDDAFLKKIPDMEEEENEMLDGAAAERRYNSRLGCQLRISSNLDGIVVHLPEKQL